MGTPVIAIVGRANVGKSTLFNKLVGRRDAIVNNQRGVTRDRKYGSAEWFGQPLFVIDTGGIDLSGDNDLEPLVAEQADLAMEEADGIIFVADCRQGLTPQDKEVVGRIRKSSKPLFLVVNKVDRPDREFDSYEFSELGLDTIYPLSAEHGHGLIELMEAVSKRFPKYEVPKRDQDLIRIAIIGRPNVGKSSLVNRLLSSPRCIVSNIPGTTRDSIDSNLTYDGVKYVLVDTAGIKRKGKTTRVLDKFSVIMSLKAIENCDIAVLVLDGKEGVTDQDATIAGYAFEKGRGCLIAVNKWDLVKNDEKKIEGFKERLSQKLKYLDFAPSFAVSARTGYNLSLFFKKVREIFQEYCKNVPTSELNECFERAIQKNPMSSFRGKFMKLYYSTQIKNRPPTFLCFVNYPAGVHFSYRRYLTNSLRKTFGFSGTPVKVIFSQRNSRN